MAKFSVEISETYVKIINVEAQTEQKAILQAMEKYWSGDIAVGKEVASVAFVMHKSPKIYLSKAQSEQAPPF
jgi:hypothetical protein